MATPHLGKKRSRRQRRRRYRHYHPRGKWEIISEDIVSAVEEEERQEIAQKAKDLRTFRQTLAYPISSFELSEPDITRR